eukprot:359718-Chlamydomonas_euryale.AAC.12
MRVAGCSPSAVCAHVLGHAPRRTLLAAVHLGTPASPWSCDSLLPPAEPGALAVRRARDPRPHFNIAGLYFPDVGHPACCLILSVGCAQHRHTLRGSAPCNPDSDSGLYTGLYWTVLDCTLDCTVWTDSGLYSDSGLYVNMWRISCGPSGQCGPFLFLFTLRYFSFVRTLQSLQWGMSGMTRPASGPAGSLGWRTAATSDLTFMHLHAAQLPCQRALKVI